MSDRMDDVLSSIDEAVDDWDGYSADAAHWEPDEQEAPTEHWKLIYRIGRMTGVSCTCGELAACSFGDDVEELLDAKFAEHLDEVSGPPETTDARSPQ